MIAAPLLLTLFSLAPIFSLGAQGKKRLCPGLAPRPNIKLLPSPHLNSYDFPTCFAIWVFLSLSLHFYTVTISVSPLTPGVGLFTRSSMPERKMSNFIITSFGRKLLVAILRSFTCGQTRRRRMCSLKASLPLASSSCVTTGYSTMEMSRGEWPYRRLGQVLGKCSTKVLVNRLIQLMFTTALSRPAQKKLFRLLHHVYLLPLYPQ